MMAEHTPTHPDATSLQRSLARPSVLDHLRGVRDFFRTPPLGFFGKSWFLPALIAVALVFLLNPYDATFNAWLTGAPATATSPAGRPLLERLPGDVRRELNAWQQFGQGTSIAVIVLIIWLLDPKNRPRLFDLGVILGVVGLLATAGKLLIGRPRPKYNDAERFIGPLGMYPVDQKSGPPILAHAWDLSKSISSDLWSMPSSHTAFAAGVAAFLATLYPKIKWLMIALACIVACGRLLFDAHYLTDVIVGGIIGWCAATIFANARPISRYLDRPSAER